MAMQKRWMIITVVAAALLAGGAAAADCDVPVSFNPAVNLFPQSAQLVTDVAIGGADASLIRFADDFTVSYMSYYKVVTNLRASKTYVLYQCGTPKPVLTDVPEGTTYFQVPVSSVASSQTVPLAFLEKLGLTQELTYADMKYVPSACLKKREQVCKDLEHVASAGTWDAETGTTPIPADWVAKAEAMGETGIVLTGSWGGGVSGTTSDVAFDASMDPGALNRAEWIKYLSLFFNKEAEANAIFKALQDNVEAIASKAGLGNDGAKPSVAWISYYQGHLVSDAAYKMDLTELAGGILHGANATVVGDSVYEDNAEFKAALKGAHVVIDEHYAGSTLVDRAAFLAKYNFTDEDITSGDYPFLTNDRLYRSDKSVGKDDYGAGYNPSNWLGDSMVNVDVTLADMAYIIQPEVFPEHSELTYFRNLMMDDEVMVSTAEHCTLSCFIASAAPTSAAPTSAAPTASPTSAAPTTIPASVAPTASPAVDAPAVEASPPQLGSSVDPDSSASGVSVGLAVMLSVLAAVLA